MPSGVYFSYFPTIPYEAFDGSGEYKVVTNIFNRVRATIEARTDKTIYYNYTTIDGETPEIVAYKYYGNARYHWVILLMNSIRDPQWSWPLDTHSFERYIKHKYGSFETAVNAHSHYETKEIRARVAGFGYSIDDIILNSGIVVDSNFTYTYAGDSFGVNDARKAVTMYDKELIDNENRRSILLLRRNLLEEFLEEFNNLIVTRK